MKLVPGMEVGLSPRDFVLDGDRNRYTWLPLLCLTPPGGGVPWDDLREILSGCPRMAKVPKAIEILSKI